MSMPLKIADYQDYLNYTGARMQRKDLINELNLLAIDSQRKFADKEEVVEKAFLLFLEYINDADVEEAFNNIRRY